MTDKVFAEDIGKVKIWVGIDGDKITYGKEGWGESTLSECCLLLGHLKLIEQELIDFMAEFDSEMEVLG